MTTLSQVRVKCGVCGSSSWQGFLSSYYPFPSVYFDSKPEGVNPKCWHQCCPTCHYCAPSIGEVEPVSSLDKKDEIFEFDDEVEEFLSRLNDESLMDVEEIDKFVNAVQKFLFPLHVEPITGKFFSKFLDSTRFSKYEERKLPHEVDKNKLIEIINSEEYRLMVSSVEVGYLSEHILYSYICEKFGWLSPAGLSSMCCAWFCDDTFYYPFRKDESQKLRKRAFNFFVRAVLSEKSFAKDLISEGLILVDISRRMGEFELANRLLNFVEEITPHYELELIQKVIIKYQKVFIKKRDTKAYKIDGDGNVFDNRGRRIKL